MCYIPLLIYTFVLAVNTTNFKMFKNVKQNLLELDNPVYSNHKNNLERAFLRMVTVS